MICRAGMSGPDLYTGDVLSTHIAAAFIDTVLQLPRGEPGINTYPGTFTDEEDERRLCCVAADCSKVHRFDLDNVYGYHADARDVHGESVLPLLSRVVDGESATLLVLGHEARHQLVEGLLTLAARGLVLEMARRMPFDLSTLANGADLCALASGDCPVTTYRLTLSWALMDPDQQDAMHDRLAACLENGGRTMSGNGPGLRLLQSGEALGGWHIAGLVETEVQDAQDVPRLLQHMGTQQEEGRGGRRGRHGVMTLSVERRRVGLGLAQRGHATIGRIDELEEGASGKGPGGEGRGAAEAVGRLQIVTLADLPQGATAGGTRLPHPSDGWWDRLHASLRLQQPGRGLVVSPPQCRLSRLLRGLLTNTRPAAILAVLDPSPAQAGASLVALELAQKLRRLSDGHRRLRQAGEAELQAAEQEALRSASATTPCTSSRGQGTAPLPSPLSSLGGECRSSTAASTPSLRRPSRRPPRRPTEQPTSTHIHGADPSTHTERPRPEPSIPAPASPSRQGPRKEPPPPPSVPDCRHLPPPPPDAHKGWEEERAVLWDRLDMAQREIARLTHQAALLGEARDALAHEAKARHEGTQAALVLRRDEGQGRVVVGGPQRDRRLQAARQQVRDYEVYKEVMEAALCRVQAEMNNLRTQRDEAKQGLGRAEAAQKKGRTALTKATKEQAQLKQKLKETERDRDRALAHARDLEGRVAVAERERAEAVKEIVAASDRHRAEKEDAARAHKEEVRRLRRELMLVREMRMGPASPAVTCLSDLMPPPQRLAMQSEALAPPPSPAPGGRGEGGLEGVEGQGSKGAREEGHGWHARREERVEPSLMWPLNGRARDPETQGVRSRAQALARQEMRPSQRLGVGKRPPEDEEQEGQDVVVVAVQASSQLSKLGPQHTSPVLETGGSVRVQASVIKDKGRDKKSKGIEKGKGKIHGAGALSKA